MKTHPANNELAGYILYVHLHFTGDLYLIAVERDTLEVRQRYIVRVYIQLEEVVAPLRDSSHTTML